MPEVDRPAMYQITVYGKLNKRWSEWFNGMTIVHETMSGRTPTTTLTGLISDQAALRGLLTKIWDLGLVLISLTRLPASHEG